MRKSVWFVFFLVLGVRLFFALSMPNFNDDSAYFILRQVEHITHHGTPLYNDNLSYGGRIYFFLPLYHYVLAFFDLFLDIDLVAKIIPNIMSSTLVFIVYKISELLTKDKHIALLSAFASGFIPVYFSDTFNSVSILAATVPLTFLLFYFLLRLRVKKNLTYYLISLVLLVLLSPYSVLVVMAMLLYLVFSWVEDFKPTRSEVELTIFSLILTIWFYFIFYRDALLFHGHKIIWQNIPPVVINQFFSQVNILDVMTQIGIVPLIGGVLALFYFIFRKQRKHIYLLLSMLMIITILLLKKYLQLDIGLIYIGVIMTILLGNFIVIIKEYLAKTHIERFSNTAILLLFIAFIFTSVVHSINSAEALSSDPSDKVTALKLLKDDSRANDTVVGSVFDGHLITYESERKNIIDSNFLLVDASERLRDIRSIYTSAIESKALEIMNKYDADYLIVTQEAVKYYNITRVAYVPSDCLQLFYSGKDIKIYKKKC